MINLFKNIIKKEKLYKSGLVPYTIKNNMIFFCLMIPSDENFGGRFPQFPKGKIENKKTSLENAIKEAEEETGISRNNIVFTEFLTKDEDKNLIWYLSKLKNFDLNEPHYESLYSFWAESSQCKRIIRATQKSILQIALERIKEIEFS